MALTGDLDSALGLNEGQIERLGREERFCYAEILRLKSWMLSPEGTLGEPKETFAPHPTGPGASRRNPGSCARRRASPASPAKKCKECVQSMSAVPELTMTCDDEVADALFARAVANSAGFVKND
jgi:hypothetical protein